jgi:hypothetical protein
MAQKKQIKETKKVDKKITKKQVSTGRRSIKTRRTGKNRKA